MELFLQLLVNGLIRGGDYMLIAVGLSLIFGVLKVVNFAHGGFFLVGGVFAYLAQAFLGAPYGLAVLVAVIASALLGVVAQRIVIRPLLKAPEESVFLSTFGLSFVILFAVVIALNSQAVSLTGVGGTLDLGVVAVEYQQLLVLGVSIVVTAGLFIILRRTRVGNVISAVAQDREVAESMGLNVHRIFSFTFAGAATMAGLAGALIVPLSVLSPFSGQTVLLTGFIIVIAAGVDNLVGVVVVAMSLALMESFAAGYISTVAEGFVGFILLIAVLIFKPQGLFGSRSDRRRRPRLVRTSA